MQMVLEVAKSAKVGSLKELRSEIKGRRYPNFETMQYDDAKDTFVPRQSERVIRRTVKFCQILHLIESDGHLTQEGRDALVRVRFEHVVAGQIRSFLGRGGIRCSYLNTVIRESLHSDPPVLPTSKELWTKLGGQTRYAVFSMMLSLLTQCGGAVSSQRKIYLNVESK
jgi:hypothetical protein